MKGSFGRKYIFLGVIVEVNTNALHENCVYSSVCDLVLAAELYNMCTYQTTEESHVPMNYK
jgi:hypothetical protein